MWHVPYTYVIQGDFLLLVMWNQIDILIPDFFFNHNLCC
jgi:hypothetical protein